ncbi:hypothetical protein QYE76_006130 [Lolium multiflorum]|uniref:Retrotransposon Copia-like N-terminal domain-containing protein n=1 Tax=Lolium multiflorum TaxID=4521 RepID=A0AAD8W1F3_LOLMU|nr:hypothetical protein QYE76_006130 [Lolium multiflorum]
MSDTSAASDVLGTMPDAASSGLPTGAVPSSSSGPFSIRNVDILTHVPVKLDYDGDNYAEWKTSMLAVLAQFDATDHVDERRHPRHGEEEWMRVDVTVVLWIYATICDELLDEVMTAHGTAREVWAQLRDFFDYEDEHVALDAGEELRYGAQGELSVDDYCWRLQALAEVLAERGEPVEDRVLTLLMLRGLSPRFQAWAPRCLSAPPSPASCRPSLGCTWRSTTRTMARAPCNEVSVRRPSSVVTTHHR